ncbi:MAG: peptidoglycan DD-metalloendopeptidase family protein [Caulobacteraceae bacterium]
MSDEYEHHDRGLIEKLFPERHLYLRSGGEVRGYVLSSGKQALAAFAAAGLAIWLGVTTAATMMGGIGGGNTEALQTKAYYERLIADRQARLNSAVVQLTASTGSIDELAKNVEKRHEALTMLLGQMRDVPGAASQLRPSISADEGTPLQRVRAIRVDQTRLIAQAGLFAKSRAERLRLAFRLAGLDPAAYSGASGGSGLGGPLIEAKDTKALAVVLDVDEDFAQRVQAASMSLHDMRALADAASRLPFAKPTSAAPRTSSYGVRFDPFTGRPAFHSGMDFSGAFFTPIRASAPGVVSFTGVRSGYGNTIEIDHGGGFKTRYAHLQAIGVSAGQRVAVNQRIGAMGSTGRSTGPHLHYEVWVGGRPQNPDRFMRAGDYVQQE